MPDTTLLDIPRVHNTTWKVMSQISDILKNFPLKSRTYENGYKNYSANCFCKFKGLQLTFQVV
jgi:inorganic pyrophosphatase